MYNIIFLKHSSIIAINNEDIIRRIYILQRISEKLIIVLIGFVKVNKEYINIPVFIIICGIQSIVNSCMILVNLGYLLLNGFK